MNSYSNYMSGPPTREPLHDNHHAKTKFPGTVQDPQILRNSTTSENLKNGGKQGQGQMNSQTQHENSVTQGSSQQRSNSFMKNFINQRSGGAIKFVRSHWQSRPSNSSSTNGTSKTTRNSRTNIQSNQAAVNAVSSFAMNENQNVQNMQYYDSTQNQLTQGNQRESKSQDEKGNAKRSISGSFIRDNKITSKIQNNVKAVSGLATNALRSLKPQSSKRDKKNIRDQQTNLNQSTEGHQKIKVPHDLQQHDGSSVASGVGHHPPPINMTNSRSYSVNRTSSTVVATVANNNNSQAGTSGVNGRDFKQFNKSSIIGGQHGPIAAQNNGSSFQSRMSESVIIAEHNRQNDKISNGGTENQRRAESLNNAMSNVTSKVYQARKPSSSVHSNDQNPSKFYNQVPHKQIKMVQKVNQSVADSVLMNQQPRFLPRSMTNNGFNSSNGGAETKSNYGGSSSGQTAILPPTTKFGDSMQTQNMSQISSNMNRSNGSQDMQNPTHSQISQIQHVPLAIIKPKKESKEISSNSMNPSGVHKAILSARQTENLTNNIDSLNLYGQGNAGSRTQILNFKESKNASQGSQSQLSMNGSIEKKKGIKCGTAEKLPEITIQQKIQMFHQRCERLIFKTLPKTDRQTIDSVYHVSEFCQSIQQNMLRVEKNWSIDYAYMDFQVKIDETTRSTLIDWLIKIHYNFKLLPESLFLTINIIDRFFSSRQIQTREVQLVALAAMLIATKYEEIYPPLLKDYVFICDQIYSAEDILEMEKSILFELDFDIQLTSSYRFLERFAKIQKLDQVTFFLSQYMLELGLLDSKMNQFSNSLQALSAIYTAKKYLRCYNQQDSSETAFSLEDFDVKQYFSMEDIRNCGKCYHQLANLIQQSKLQMITQKFKGHKFFEVARIVSTSLKQKTPYKRSKHNSGSREVIQSSQMQTRSSQQPQEKNYAPTHNNSQSRTSRADLSSKDTSYKLSQPATDLSAQAQQSYQASAWQAHPSNSIQTASHTNKHFMDEAAAHNFVSSFNQGASMHQQTMLNSAIMSAQIESNTDLAKTSQTIATEQTEKDRVTTHHS